MITEVGGSASALLSISSIPRHHLVYKSSLVHSFQLAMSVTILSSLPDIALKKSEFLVIMQRALFSLFSICIIVGSTRAYLLSSATAPSPQASAACLEISTGTAETQIWPLALTNPDYADAKNHYYSAANADLTPACAVFPTSAAEVSYVIKVLLKYPTVPFAVKGGGHNPNVGFSSTNWGVLITFSKDAATEVSANNATVVIGPGARWGQVITALEPYDLAVVGGRLGKHDYLPLIYRPTILTSL